MAGSSGDNLALLARLADELAAAAGALLGTTDTAAESAEPSDIAWTVRAAVAGSARGSIALGFEAAGVASLARRALGFDQDPEDEVIADMLRELCTQALGALAQAQAGKGMQFAVEAPARDQSAPAAAQVGAFRLRLDDTLATVVMLWSDVTPAAGTQPAVPPVAVAAPSTRPEQAPGAPAPAPAFPNLDVILDIDLPLSVRFGETEMTVDALTRLGPGSVIDLGRSPDDPVDVLINGRMVARGEVVVVGGSYGVRITEVVSAADRLRTMAA